MLTGVVTEGSDVRGIDPRGSRISIVITNSDPPVVGFDVSYVSGHTIAPCTSNPILSAPTVQGHFVFRP